MLDVQRFFHKLSFTFKRFKYLNSFVFILCYSGHFLLFSQQSNPTPKQMLSDIGKKISLEDIVKNKIGTEGTIYIVGLAGDICVLDTAINGAKKFPNNKVRIIYEFIRPAFVLEAHRGFGYVNTPDNYCDKLKLSENLKMISIQGLPTLYTWNKYKTIIRLGAVVGLLGAAYKYWRSTGFGKKTKRTSKKRKSRRRKSSVRRKRSVKK